MVENVAGATATKCFPAAWNVGAKPCDCCKSAVALLFCRKDSVYLCMACDVKLHGDMKHERVWMCEVCEQAPASVTCKADAAALCVTCDRDIHSVNPLARRHERIPVVTFYDSAESVVKSTAGDLLDPVSGFETTELITSGVKDVNVSWGIPTDTTDINVTFPTDISAPPDMKSIDLYSVTDRLFDFGFAIPTEVRLQTQFSDSISDSVVPMKSFPAAQMVNHKSAGAQYEIDFTRSTTNSFNKSSSKSLSHSVSSSSMDVGVVPEENSMLESSYPFILPVSGGVESNGGTNDSEKARRMDREARVLRYREKRKNRKFEKKIRYASRKAYAEMRPRIKGRFVKRTESTAELEVDRWLFTAASNSNNSYGGGVEYGVVPSF